MIIFSKSYDEAKKLLDEAIKKNYPKSVDIAIFIDDGMDKGFMTENVVHDFKFNKEITACYNAVLRLFNALITDMAITDFYCIGNKGGLKITIQEEKEDKNNMEDILKYENFALTDEEIQHFADLFNNRFKGQNHLMQYELNDAACYGFNCCYDLLLGKIYDAVKKVRETQKPSAPKNTYKNDKETWDAIGKTTITIDEISEILEELFER